MNKILEEKKKKICAKYREMTPDLVEEYLVWREFEMTAYFKWEAEIVKKRIEENRKLSPVEVTLANFHSHSCYSDGSTYGVQEISEWAERYGLDWIAVTDHWTLRHAFHCRKFKNLWWGKEASAEGYHLLVFGMDEAFGEEFKNNSMQQMVSKVSSARGLVIIAHPCGWYTAETKPEAWDKILQAEGILGLEIGNAEANLESYYDITDQRALHLWDRILCSGKRVLGFGNPDAHLPYSHLAMVWNGFAGRISTCEELFAHLPWGNHFVSDGPFAFLDIDEVPMGGTVQTRSKKIKVKVSACDCEGIKEIRLIRKGEIICREKVNLDKEVCFEKEEKYPEEDVYYRAEVFSKDYRRAYTNPVWVKSYE